MKNNFIIITTENYNDHVDICFVFALYFMWLLNICCIIKNKYYVLYTKLNVINEHPQGVISTEVILSSVQMVNLVINIQFTNKLRK